MHYSTPQVARKRRSLGCIPRFRPKLELATEILRQYKSGLNFAEIYDKVRHDPHYQSETVHLNHQTTIRYWLLSQGATLRVGRREWSIADRLKLQELRSSGTPYEVIAKKLGRTAEACQVKYGNLGGFSDENRDIRANRRRPWTQEETQEALKKHLQDESYGAIAKQLDRSKRAVECQIVLAKKVVVTSLKKEISQAV